MDTGGPPAHPPWAELLGPRGNGSPALSLRDVPGVVAALGCGGPGFGVRGLRLHFPSAPNQCRFGRVLPSPRLSFHICEVGWYSLQHRVGEAGVSSPRSPGRDPALRWKVGKRRKRTWESGDGVGGRPSPAGGSRGGCRSALPTLLFATSDTWLWALGPGCELGVSTCPFTFRELSLTGAGAALPADSSSLQALPSPERPGKEAPAWCSPPMGAGFLGRGCVTCWLEMRPRRQPPPRPGPTLPRRGERGKSFQIGWN